MEGRREGRPTAAEETEEVEKKREVRTGKNLRLFLCLSVGLCLSALRYARQFTKVTRKEIMGGAGAAWGRSVGRSGYCGSVQFLHRLKCKRL